MQAIKNKKIGTRKQLEETESVLPEEKNITLVKKYFRRLITGLFSKDPNGKDNPELLNYNDKVRAKRAQAEASVRMFLFPK